MVWVTFFLLVPQAFGAAISLDKAVSLCLERSPALKMAEALLKEKELEKDNATARFLPSVDLSASHGLDASHPTKPDAPWVSGVNLSLTENLYDNGRTFAQRRIALLNLELARVSFERARANLILNVVEQFYRTSLNSRLEQIRKEQLGLIKEQFAMVSNLYRQGMRTRSDYLRFRNQLQKAEIDHRASESNRRQSNEELFRLLAMAESERPNSQFELLENPRGNAVGKANLKLAYDYQMDELATKVKDEEVFMATRQYFPQVNVTLGASYTNQGYLGGSGFGANEQYGANALLGLRWMLWDWGIQRRDWEIAEVRKTAADEKLKETFLRLTAEFNSLQIGNAVTLLNFEAADQLLKSEKENYNFIQREYREGKLAYLDLITAMDSLLDAKQRYYSALYAAADDYARGLYYEGKLYEVFSKS